MKDSLAVRLKCDFKTFNFQIQFLKIRSVLLLPWSCWSCVPSFRISQELGVGEWIMREAVQVFGQYIQSKKKNHYTKTQQVMVSKRLVTMEGLKHYLWALNTVKTKTQGLPSGSMEKNPPASAGDAGSIPDQRMRTCCRAVKPASNNNWSWHPRARAPQQEKLI